MQIIELSTPCSRQTTTSLFLQTGCPSRRPIMILSRASTHLNPALPHRTCFTQQRPMPPQWPHIHHPVNMLGRSRGSVCSFPAITDVTEDKMTFLIRIRKSLRTKRDLDDTCAGRLLLYPVTSLSLRHRAQSSDQGGDDAAYTRPFCVVEFAVIASATSFRCMSIGRYGLVCGYR